VSNSAPSYRGIKVNIITGFLGAGKTTLIKHLLRQVPNGESWAVLVNEFGEVGLDKDLLEADLKSDLDSRSDNSASLDNIAIKQVAGGCLCCTTSAAFQVSLNTLIKKHNPDRILIEPSGLGHPKNILKQLQSPYYQSVLKLESVLCLLDARNLDDARYVNHPNFIEQIAMADILIASKTELYQERDWQTFHAYTATLNPAKKHIETIKSGQLALSWLEVRSERKIDENKVSTLHSDLSLRENPDDILIEQTKAPGFYIKTSGSETNLAWVFKDDILFDQAKVTHCFDNLQSHSSLLRIKAVLQLDKQHSLLLNASAYDQKLELSDKQTGSKIELILISDKLSDENLSEIKASIALLSEG